MQLHMKLHRPPGTTNRGIHHRSRVRTARRPERASHRTRPLYPDHEHCGPGRHLLRSRDSKHPTHPGDRIHDARRPTRSPRRHPPDLDFGTHTIIVRTVNPSGNEAVTAYQITVKAPIPLWWWVTAGTAAVSLLLAVWFTVHSRTFRGKSLRTPAST